MPSIRAPATKKTTTLTVAVKCRPFRLRERGRDIVRVIDNKEVLVLDPDLSKDYLERIQNRTKEKKYCFDHAFDPVSSNLDVYTKCISSVISGVVHGLNATVFAYGSTGSGKTYTMVGTQDDPGLMVLSLHTIFDLIKKDKSSDEFEVTCSYLEVYNEVIYDLLEKSSGHLELREDPEQGVIVAGLRCIKVQSADKILELLNLGNSRRKTESTEANTTSSSKLTRILKDGLSGNSQTIMVATVSPVDSQYHHTVNTMKYADRAKEIKTHIQKNIGTIDTHVSDYQQMIDSLQIEVCQLRKELAEKESQLSVKPVENAADDELSWLNILSHETSENVQERINLQKASFELEETNLRNRIELQHLDDAIAKQQAIGNDSEILEAMRMRRQVILDNIRDNDEAGVNYHMEIEANEKHRCHLQNMIEEAISNNGNKTYLRILSQYRLLGMANTELQFEMAMRDQVINSQREALRNMWDLLMGLGLDERQIMDVASKKGITIEEDSTTTPHLGLSVREQSPDLDSGKYASFGPCRAMGHSYSRSSSTFQQSQELGLRSFPQGHLDLTPSFCREEHHSSYYLLSHDHSPSACMCTRTSSEHWVGGRSSSWFGTMDKHPQDLRKSYPVRQN